MNPKLTLIEERLPEFYKLFVSCALCVRKCGINRLSGEKGYCFSGAETVIHSYGSHHGEEPVLSGDQGSGTIFFSNCSMKCIYCQNYSFSQTEAGKEFNSEELAGIMIKLQNEGCHNINLVNPTHYMPKIIEALGIAYNKNLNIPIVYNTGGFDNIELIKLLDGIVDIYLSDMRYSDNKMAEKYSFAPHYVENNREVVEEMFRQIPENDKYLNFWVKGVIIRLLILPNDISGTTKTLEYISDKITKNIPISIMSQYYPAYKAKNSTFLSRRINLSEYLKVKKIAESLGFQEGWIQPFESDFDPKLAGENFKSNT